MSYPWQEPAASRLQLPFARDQLSNGIYQAAAGSAVITFGVNPAPGSMVLVAVANQSGALASVVDNGTTPLTFTSDNSNRAQSYNITIFRGAGITLPASGGYTVTCTGTGVFAAAAISYTGPFGQLVSIGTGGGTSAGPATASAKGMLVFGAMSDSNNGVHAIVPASPVFTQQFSGTTGVGSIPGGFQVGDFLASTAPVSTQAIGWTLASSYQWEAAAVGYLPLWDMGANLSVDGTIDVNTAGNGLRVAEGSNAKQGTATLTAGSVVVSNTSVTANSRIFLTSNADGGTPGFVRVSARSAGTSFTITSSSGTDTSTIAYEIFEPG